MADAGVAPVKMTASATAPKRVDLAPTNPS
jgi:hypothetical protein